MGSVDVGQQKIGWKYSTPLQADYLNTFIAGLTTPGLVTRPQITATPTSSGADVIIPPFSLLIVPEDEPEGKDKSKPIHKLVKITTTSNIALSIGEGVIALGFKYSFKDESAVTKTQWYGEVVRLTWSDFHQPDPADNFHGIVIATCQWFNSSSGRKYSVTTSGADISDALLREEGWDPHCWLSLVHPSRSDYLPPGESQMTGVYNRLEVRKHNDLFTGYMNGSVGCVSLSNLVYTMDTDVDPLTNPYGIRGLMPNNVNLFKIQAGGFELAPEGGTQLPVAKTSGGVFALADATQTNMMTDTGSFANLLKLYPVMKEDLNIYVDEDTLYIR